MLLYLFKKRLLIYKIPDFGILIIQKLIYN